jgi:biopolymer transport protein ExbD
MATQQVKTQETISPQIIPMIDIMFLILLFFMLSSDMGQRELEDVRLPRAEGARVDDGPPTLTVNCYHLDAREAPCARYEAGAICRDAAHWRIAIRGRDYAEAELAAALEELAAAERRDPRSRVSELAVEVRADASALYGLVQAVMRACEDAGVYRLEIGAAARGEG